MQQILIEVKSSSSLSWAWPSSAPAWCLNIVKISNIYILNYNIMFCDQKISLLYSNSLPSFTNIVVMELFWGQCQPSLYDKEHFLSCLKPKKIIGVLFSFSFLSSANEVSTGPTCQFLSVCLSVCLFVCLFVCLSGLFFKASNWMIYWLLTVVLATYLSE